VGKGTEIVHHIAAEQRHDIISEAAVYREQGVCEVCRVGSRWWAGRRNVEGGRLGVVEFSR